MKTVKKMIEELNKFPLNACCYGYEGDAVGIGIKTDDGKYGFIFCSENPVNEDEVKSEELK